MFNVEMKRVVFKKAAIAACIAAQLACHQLLFDSSSDVVHPADICCEAV